MSRRKTAIAYDVLRGHPVRPDYGYLVVLPLIAAAGGALIAWGIETLVSHRRPVTAPAAAAERRLEPVSA
ncbi:hypothetical protein [Actinoplanes sp. HUAS TT8]|uniref:hypothetical protein n=1 Tax=Actinoplanes sp. HUAS TT8 TaxID=3447453 RepID=UPI003F51F5C6